MKFSAFLVLLLMTVWQLGRAIQALRQALREFADASGSWEEDDEPSPTAEVWE